MVVMPFASAMVLSNEQTFFMVKSLTYRSMPWSAVQSRQIKFGGITYFGSIQNILLVQMCILFVMQVINFSTLFKLSYGK